GQWILKHYFHHPNDQRDRLGTEFDFLQFFNPSCMTNLPRAIGMDRDLGCALYSMLPGTRPQTIDKAHISQAAAFMIELQNYRNVDGADKLPLAAEGCLSWQAHLDILTRRIDRLRQIEPDPEINAVAHVFIRDTLIPGCQRLLQKLSNTMSPEYRDAEIKQESRILSPSDFGFHNTLAHEHRLAFVDFEYAGWDDPAKLICDFTCQPEVPISSEQATQFSDALLAGLADDGTIAQRVTQLLPLHRLKWCCILLNEFKNEDWQRRQHAGIDSNTLLATQLDKAKAYFHTHCATSE
ncbi:MAG TPA: phosphotransferase, partial [Burkholderiaceae bacterium]|nr:phosphotransferase [Burkholderiaceae bacterium]